MSDGRADRFARARNYCRYVCWAKEWPHRGEGAAPFLLLLVVRALATTRPHHARGALFRGEWVTGGAQISKERGPHRVEPAQPSPWCRPRQPSQRKRKCWWPLLDRRAILG